jgi:hypothetical protein
MASVTSWEALDGLTFAVKRSWLMTRQSSHTVRFNRVFDDISVLLADVPGPAASDALGVRW